MTTTTNTTNTTNTTERAIARDTLKGATSVIRDWSRPNSWSTGTLRASASQILSAPLDLLSSSQIELLSRIADGREPRPEL